VTLHTIQPVDDLAQRDRIGRSRIHLGPDRPGGRFEEISLVTKGRLHMSRVLDFRLGEGVLLFVDLDRTRGNMALASLRAGQLAPAILA
jgi:hypothetical protein